MNLLGTDWWCRRLIKTCSDEDDSNARLWLFTEDDDELVVWLSSIGKIPFVSKDIKAMDWIDESYWDSRLSLSLSMIVWSCGGRRVNTGERHDEREVLQFLEKRN